MALLNITLTLILIPELTIYSVSWLLLVFFYLAVDIVQCVGVLICSFYSVSLLVDLILHHCHHNVSHVSVYVVVGQKCSIPH